MSPVCLNAYVQLPTTHTRTYTPLLQLQTLHHWHVVPLLGQAEGEDLQLRTSTVNTQGGGEGEGMGWRGR